MKKLIATTLSLVTLATATGASASAHHCTVQPGESIWRIAQEYHLDFETLKELNRRLHDDLNLIHPGDKVHTHADTGTGKDHDESTGATGNAQPDNSVTEKETSASETQAQAVLNLVNSERAKQGLKPLKLDSALNQVATAKAKDMADNGYFSHDSPTYGSPFDQMRTFGIDYKSAGENIAAGQKTAQDVMNSWMNSAGHRANILNPNYTNLGVGYYAGGSYGVYWVQSFTQK